jgi:hypothetical protein
MDENKLINEITRAIEKSVAFFSPRRKKDRELWIVEEFLKNLGINFNKEELKYSYEEPIDIVFRDANFQIKEIQEKERKRHKEFKDDLKKARCAKQFSELLTHSIPQKITLQEIVNRMQEELQSYIIDPAETKNVDILFYENIGHWGISSIEYVLPCEWEKWRSVSMVGNGGICLIFCAKEDAPDFIRSNVGKLFRAIRESPFDQ